jgi:hypothetical protein
MKAGPSLSVKRGSTVLDPGYFTSQAYVERLRGDIVALTDEFEKQYRELEDKTKPFTLFKDIWQEQGWSWLHLRFTENRGRESFLKVSLRLFLGRRKSDQYRNGKKTK